MRVTSAQAAKLIRTLNEEQAALREKERKASTFLVSLEEKAEDVRPAYDYEAVQAQLDDCGRRIRLAKHALNLFNLETRVPGFDMTVDQMLIYIPQLTEKKKKLAEMAGRLPRERQSTNGYGARTIVEYEYANYDIQKAQADLEEVSGLLAEAQTALDTVNNTATLEINLE